MNLIWWPVIIPLQNDKWEGISENALNWNNKIP